MVRVPDRKWWKARRSSRGKRYKVMYLDDRILVHYYRNGKLVARSYKRKGYKRRKRR